MASADMSLIKLVLGPGLTWEPTTTPSYSNGVGQDLLCMYSRMVTDNGSGM
jgi:hypothetical protein